MNKLLIPFLFIFQVGLSQNSSDTLYLKKGPVYNGYLLKYIEFKSGISDPSNFITIYSQKSEVFAINSGFVKTQFTIQSDNFIGIESGDTLIVYGRIRSIKKKGEQVLKEEKIGELTDLSRSSYRLLLSISTIKESSILNYIELVDLLVGRYGKGNFLPNNVSQ